MCQQENLLTKLLDESRETNALVKGILQILQQNGIEVQNVISPNKQPLKKLQSKRQMMRNSIQKSFERKYS